MGNNADLLQESLVAALRTDPLLIRAEEFLHSAQRQDIQELLEDNLTRLLEPGLAIAEIDHLQYRGLDSGMISRFRAAMEAAVSSGANLADAESQILESVGLSKVGELRAAMQSHLGAAAELPEQTLAIYVPKADRGQEDFHRALQQDLQALEAALEQPVVDTAEAELPPVSPVEPSQEPMVVADRPPVPAAAGPVDVDSDLRVTLGLTAERQGSGGKRLAKLNPIPMLTAALEAVGLGGDGFGFVLRYGRYAPEGRKSEFLVGGLGLADLSKRLTAWLDTQGPLEGQVQVIDEGSGELTVYLLLPEAA
ncbi:MAG: hypothetical protein ACRDHG_14365 [Anaerolineales bacterium]